MLFRSKPRCVIVSRGETFDLPITGITLLNMPPEDRDELTKNKQVMVRIGSGRGWNPKTQGPGERCYLLVVSIIPGVFRVKKTSDFFRLSKERWRKSCIRCLTSCFPRAATCWFLVNTLCRQNQKKKKKLSVCKKACAR